MRVAELVAHGVDRVFCVPGESYLSVLDALYDRPEIQVVAGRHEAGAANMASAHARLTGQVGVCFVTRGPGASHAMIGVHTAQQDSVPILLFIGQVARGHAEREAFQEIEYRRLFAPVAKWAAQIELPGRVQEFVRRGFAVAAAGRQGPVVLALPEDMLDEAVDAEPAGPAPRAAAAPAPEAVAELAVRLDRAKSPLLLLGGTGWTEAALLDVRGFVERFDLPVATAFRRKDLFDNNHPNYAGELALSADPALVKRLQQSDLVLALGTRLGDPTTGGYERLSVEQARRTLVHMHPSAEELGRVYPPAQGIVASVAEAASALTELPGKRSFGEVARAARAAYDAYIAPVGVGGSVNLSEVFGWLSNELADDAIVTNGAGNYAGWLHRFYQHRRFRTQLAPTNGAMGYGLPAALAAKLAFPDRSVVAVAGDGCFLMASAEFATELQYGVAIVVLVVDNGSYGTIRMHQERDFPGRTVATDLKNPDFAAYARAFGGYGATVTRTAEFAEAFRAAVASGLPAIVTLKTELADIAPGRRLQLSKD
jgi:acetolactate synthase-1/2/3 large subunit